MTPHEKLRQEILDDMEEGSPLPQKSVRTLIEDYDALLVQARQDAIHETMVICAIHGYVLNEELRKSLQAMIDPPKEKK